MIAKISASKIIKYKYLGLSVINPLFLEYSKYLSINNKGVAEIISE